VRGPSANSNSALATPFQGAPPTRLSIGAIQV